MTYAGGLGRNRAGHSPRSAPPPSLPAGSEERKKPLNGSNDHTGPSERVTPGSVRPFPFRVAVGTAQATAATLAWLSEELRAAAWDLALEVVEEGLLDDAIPSLGRLG